MSSPPIEQMSRDSVMLETIAATTTEMAEACKSKPAMQDLPMTLGWHGSKTEENKHTSTYVHTHIIIYIHTYTYIYDICICQGTDKVRILVHHKVILHIMKCTYLHPYIQSLPLQTCHTPRGIHWLEVIALHDWLRIVMSLTRLGHKETVETSAAAWFFSLDPELILQLPVVQRRQ